MVLTWTFLLLFVLIIIPGFVIRKLFYYGEFSRQFGSHAPILKQIFYLLIPGLVNLISTTYIYHNLISSIDLGAVIDVYKDFHQPDKRFKEINGYTVLQQAHMSAMPYIGILYTTAILTGLLCGRVIRITGLDLRFKLLRYKNTWFYLFNGFHSRIKKYSGPHQKIPKKHKFQFTQADVLIKSTPDRLYSGIVVDYELKDDNCQELKTIVLKDAKRYSSSRNEHGAKELVAIPGNLFVLDCKELININLNFVYGAKDGSVISNIPKYVFLIFGVICILIVPLFIFKIKWFDWEIYSNLMTMPFWARIVFYLFTIQILQVFIPYYEENGRYKIATFKIHLLRIVMLIVLFSLSALIYIIHIPKHLN
jgi:hypothetical protein